MKNMVDRRVGVDKPEEVEVRFEGKNLTNVGGIGLIRKFATKLGMERVLEHHVKLPRRAGKYTPGRLLLSLVYAFVLDLTRLSDTRLLKEDKVAHTLLGVTGFPDPSTFSRFLSKFTVRKAQGIGRANAALMMTARRGLADLSRITLDLDSHVKTVYGNQQRASVGYNPKKPGRKSYHPLLCFIGETRDFLWGRFRSGNCYSGHGAVSFLHECLRLLPKGVAKIQVRGDSSFFDGGFLDELERRGISYAIAGKLYRTIQRQLGGVEYRDIGRGVSVGEFRYGGQRWEKERRLVVIREGVKEGKNKKQPALIELQGYTYQVIVTNLEQLAPEEAWRWYNGRACVENMIKEGVLSYGLDVSPSHYYGGNAAHFFLVMVAYNLMNWFKEVVLGQREVKRMAKWIRQRFLLIAGKLVRTGRRWILKLPRDWPWKGAYLNAQGRLATLEFG